MNNKFSISRKELLSLFNEARMVPVKEIIEKFKKDFSPSEFQEQLRTQTGPVYQAANEYWTEFGSKTENVEILTAIGLSDFYFGTGTETLISLEMKADFRKKAALSYEEIVENINPATHIDCAIEGNEKELNFQIKTYKEKRLAHANEPFLKWLEPKVLEHYGDMKGTILVVVLQPQLAHTVTAFNFDELAIRLAELKEKISFDEVTFTYTDGGRNTATLEKLFPERKRVDIPLPDMLARFRGDI